MMAENTGFEVKIKNGENEILIDPKSILKVEFMIDTVDENAKDRSENIINKVFVKGKITGENKAVTKELLLWSLASKNDEVYRNVEITIRLNETERVRKYLMNKVFCLDYMERFNREDSTDENRYTFELKFSQRKDNLEGIQVLC